jgi:hypothetical protein
MPINIGTVDRITRVLIGVALLSMLFLMDGSARWLGLIGIIPLATGVVRWCPAYSVLGISTRLKPTQR